MTNLQEELDKLEVEHNTNEKEQERLKVVNHFLKKRIKLLMQQIESEKEWKKPGELVNGVK